MNQGRIWCVVSPTVGLPLLLGSVALTSLVVHGAVMARSTWFNYDPIGKKAAVSMNGSNTAVASLDAKAQPAFTISVSPVAPTAGKTETAFVVTVSPTGSPSAAKSVTLAQK
jgi:light-harvesting protein B-800-850 alpha chain